MEAASKSTAILSEWFIRDTFPNTFSENIASKLASNEKFSLFSCSIHRADKTPNELGNYKKTILSVFARARNSTRMMSFLSCNSEHFFKTCSIQTCLKEKKRRCTLSCDAIARISGFVWLVEYYIK